MHTEYFDIIEKISEPPTWFDENAVPRYCAFSPGRVADIYAREAVLFLIECQACSHKFTVCLTSRGRSLAEDIRKGELHYGDPPNVECCPAGPSMNCVDLRVLEYWRRDARMNWDRDQSLEIELRENDGS